MCVFDCSTLTLLALSPFEFRYALMAARPAYSPWAPLQDRTHTPWSHTPQHSSKSSLHTHTHTTKRGWRAGSMITLQATAAWCAAAAAADKVLIDSSDCWRLKSENKYKVPDTQRGTLVFTFKSKGLIYTFLPSVLLTSIRESWPMMKILSKQGNICKSCIIKITYTTYYKDKAVDCLQT